MTHMLQRNNDTKGVKGLYRCREIWKKIKRKRERVSELRDCKKDREMRETKSEKREKYKCSAGEEGKEGNPISQTPLNDTISSLEDKGWPFTS